MANISDYKVGRVVSVEECSTCKKSNKRLYACRIDIGADAEISVVTAASNVRQDSRVVVAPINSYISKNGEDVKVTKATVGGVVSEGMLCDSDMLGWSGGAKGVAVQVPESFSLGDAPPSSKPRMDGGGKSSGELPVSNEPGLFEKKLSKEERKKLAEEKRKARRAAKAASKASEK